MREARSFRIFRWVVVIFLGSLQAAGHEAFLAQAMPIVESFQFNIGQ